MGTRRSVRGLPGAGGPQEGGVRDGGGRRRASPRGRRGRGGLVGRLARGGAGLAGAFGAAGVGLLLGGIGRARCVCLCLLLGSIDRGWPASASATAVSGRLRMERAAGLGTFRSLAATALNRLAKEKPSVCVSVR